MTRILPLLLCLSAFISPAQEKIQRHSDLAYIEGLPATDTLRRLNLVIPQDVVNPPLLIWIGGGAWSYVDRNVEMELAQMLAGEGIAVASVGHRLSPATWRNPALSTGVEHPAHMQDIARAVQWLVANNDKYDFDANNIFIGGYSSGAHLAALLTMDKTYLEAVNLEQETIRGVIPISGTFDIQHYYDILRDSSRPELAELHVEAVFGNDHTRYADASPISFLDEVKAPMLLMSDSALYTYTRYFEDKIRESRYRNVEVIYAYAYSHAGLWRNMSREKDSPYRKAIINFIDAHRQ